MEGEPNRPDPADFLERPLEGEPNENIGSPFSTTYFLPRLRFLRFCRGDSFAPPVFTSTYLVSFLPVSQLLRVALKSWPRPVRFILYPDISYLSRTRLSPNLPWAALSLMTPLFDLRKNTRMRRAAP